MEVACAAAAAGLLIAAYAVASTKNTGSEGAEGTLLLAAVALSNCRYPFVVARLLRVGVPPFVFRRPKQQSSQLSIQMRNSPSYFLRAEAASPSPLLATAPIAPLSPEPAPAPLRGSANWKAPGSSNGRSSSIGGSSSQNKNNTSHINDAAEGSGAGLFLEPVYDEARPAANESSDDDDTSSAKSSSANEDEAVTDGGEGLLVTPPRALSAHNRHAHVSVATSPVSAGAPLFDSHGAAADSDTGAGPEEVALGTLPSAPASRASSSSLTLSSSASRGGSVDSFGDELQFI